MTDDAITSDEFDSLLFYNQFCPAFNWVRPEITTEQTSSELFLNPQEKQGNRNVTLRQFMFNGFDTMYYHCDVSLIIFCSDEIYRVLRFCERLYIIRRLNLSF